jgi:hypothetical protein
MIIDSYSGYSGYSGKSGASGISGISGAVGRGDSGFSGASGYSGTSGVSGATGRGDSGYSGYSGKSGYSGLSGASGGTVLINDYSGYSGYSGRSGYSGYSGISGWSGIGARGDSGYSGLSGLSGLSGTSGYSGMSGVGGYVKLDPIQANTTYYLGLSPIITGNWSTGTVDATNLYYTSGDQTLYATNINFASDATLKDNVKTIANANEVITKLRGVEFTWKNNGKSSYGVIAQEIEQILPEIVSDVDGRKSVNYVSLIGFLIESVKSLKHENEQIFKILSNLSVKGNL